MSRSSARTRAVIQALLTAKEAAEDPLVAALLIAELAELPAPDESVHLALHVAARPIPTMVLDGHTDTITSLAFGPSGHWLASGSRDGTVRVWSLDGSGYCSVLTDHRDAVTGVVVSPDGRLLASASRDGTALLHRVDRSRAARALFAHAGVVTSCAFSPDGRWVVVTSTDGTARLCGVHDDSACRVLDGHVGGARSAAFNDEGDELLSLDGAGHVRLWSLRREGAVTSVTSGHDVVAAVLDPDHDAVVTASADGTIHRWELHEPGRVTQLDAGHAARPDLEGVESAHRGYTPAAGDGAFTTAHPIVALSRDSCLLTRGRGGTLSLRRLDDPGAPQRTLSHGARAIRAGAFCDYGALVATGDEDGCIRVWPTTEVLAPRRVHLPERFVRALVPLEDGGVGIDVLRRWGRGSAPTVERWRVPMTDGSDGVLLHRRLTQVTIAPAGTCLLARHGQRLVVLRVAPQAATLIVADDVGRVRAHHFTSDGAHLLVARVDDDLASWHVASGARVWHRPRIARMVLAPGALEDDAPIVWPTTTRRWGVSTSSVGGLVGVWSADLPGYRMLIASRATWAHYVEGRALLLVTTQQGELRGWRTDGWPRTLPDDGQLVCPDVSSVKLAPGDSHGVVRTRDGRLLLLDDEFTAIRMPVAELGANGGCAWNPNGTHLAFWRDIAPQPPATSDHPTSGIWALHVLRVGADPEVISLGSVSAGIAAPEALTAWTPRWIDNDRLQGWIRRPGDPDGTRRRAVWNLRTSGDATSGPATLFRRDAADRIRFADSCSPGSLAWAVMGDGSLRAWLADAVDAPRVLDTGGRSVRLLPPAPGVRDTPTPNIIGGGDDAPWIAAAFDDGTACVWTSHDLSTMVTLDAGPGGTIHRLGQYGDRRLFARTGDGSSRHWIVEVARVVPCEGSPPAGIRRGELAVSRDGRLAVHRIDGTTCLVRLDDASYPAVPLLSHDGRHHDFRFSADDRWLVAGVENDVLGWPAVDVWDVARQSEARRVTNARLVRLQGNYLHVLRTDDRDMIAIMPLDGGADALVVPRDVVVLDDDCVMYIDRRSSPSWRRHSSVCIQRVDQTAAPIILTSPDCPIRQVACVDGHVVALRDDGEVLLWATTWRTIAARFRAWTTARLSPEQRRRLLGEPPNDAPAD